MKKIKNLVIVESPAKAKTIEKYLGSDFSVLSSIGHIRSIPKKSKDGKNPIDIKNHFKTTYEVDPDKKKVVSELKKATKLAESVWLATDEDREGEAIAWHLSEVLKLDPKTTKRIVFHEITKSAIEEAIKKPRTINMKLVEAQQARQILDRIVGYELSPVVWQKVPGGKSAGRVQSPAVRLIVEKEREIEKFEGSFSFKISAVFKHASEEFEAEITERFESEQSAEQFLKSLVGAKFSAADVVKSPGSRNPSAPFTTSTLQQEANSRLGFSARTTMSNAQKLYQEGKITYMRTDSTNLSNQAVASIASYIEKAFGKNYSTIRKFKTKVANAQEAHEAIRPTDITSEKASSDAQAQKLYSLIRNRTLASQMAPAQLEKTTITIDLTTSDSKFQASGETVIFDGFLKVYGKNKEDKLLPMLAVGQNLDLVGAQAKQVFSRPPARYSEGSLVKKLEELGIGRPSTYATIIGTIQARGYAQRGESEGIERGSIVIELKNNKIERKQITEKTGSTKGKLVPAPSGEVLTDFLVNHFNRVVDYNFTAQVETEFDQIANGNLGRSAMLNEFYEPFHELIQKSGSIERKAVSQAREVGVDPKTGLVILARYGRFGPMLQLGSGEDENKPEFAPMPKGSKIDNVTLEQALEAFKLPRLVGVTEEGDEIKSNIGRFGPYIQVGKMYVSLKTHDPHTISEAEARTLIQEKIEADKAKNINEFPSGIKIINGRFGPYITNGVKNAKIDKKIDPASLSEKEAQAILDSASSKPKRPRKKSKK